MIKQKVSCLSDEIGLDESIDSDACEEHADDADHDYTDILDALEPGGAVPAHSLEHAPESVYEVEPDGGEPDEVDHEHPPLAEYGSEEEVRIILESADVQEFWHLHLGPEVEEMEEDGTQDDDSEHEHIACRPGIGSRLACNLIALHTTTGANVLEGQPAAVGDVDEESQSKHRDHD